MLFANWGKLYSTHLGKLIANVLVDVVLVEHDESVFTWKVEIALGVQVRFTKIEEYAASKTCEAQIVEQLCTVNWQNLLNRLELHDETSVIEIRNECLCQSHIFIYKV